MKKLLLCSGIMLFLSSGNVPDYTEKGYTFLDFDFDQMLECLDQTEFTSGILYDRTVAIAGLSKFNEENNISGLVHFEQALNELYVASNRSRFISNDSFKEYINLTNTNTSIPIGIIDADFQTLNFHPEFPEEGGLLLKDGKFEPISGKPSFVTHSTLVIAPLKEYVMGNNLTYKVDDRFWFDTNSRKIESLTANFDTEKTYTLIENGRSNSQEIKIEYSESGYKTLKFTALFKDGGMQTTQGQIHVKLPISIADPLVETIHLKSTIPFKGYDETTAIYGEIDYRTYYHTNGGNTQKKLLKPIIIIDGFDPQDRRKFEDADSPLPANDHRSIAEIMRYLNNGKVVDLIEILRDLGYDVILVNHPNYISNGKKIDGGADYIERNAMNMVTLINTLNAKLKTNGSSEN